MISPLRHSLGWIFLLSIASLLLLCHPAQGEEMTLYVATDGSGNSTSCSLQDPCQSLTQAVNIFTNSSLLTGIFQIAPGVYSGADNENIKLPHANITLQRWEGTNISLPILFNATDPSGHCLSARSTLQVQGIAFQGCQDGLLFSTESAQSLTLQGVTISATQSAVIMTGGTLHMQNSTITRGELQVNANAPGCSITILQSTFSNLEGSPLTIDDRGYATNISISHCTFQGNMGGLTLQLGASTLLLQACVLDSFHADANSPAPLEVTGGRVIMENVQVTNNKNKQPLRVACETFIALLVEMDESNTYGIHVTAPSVQIIASTFRCAQTGLWISSASSYLYNVTFNNARQPVLLIPVNDGSTSLEQCTFTNTGGVRYADFEDQLNFHGTVEHCRFTEVAASALWIWGGHWEVTDTVVESAETSTWDTHAFYFHGYGDRASNPTEFILSDCTFHDLSSASDGAALFVQFVDLLVVSSSNFTSNQARNGGAVYVDTARNVTFCDCSFSDNEASNEGGALYLLSYGAAQVCNGLFSSNQAAQGNAIYFGGAPGAAALLETSTLSGTFGSLVYVECNSLVQISDLVMSPGTDAYCIACSHSDTCNATVSYLSEDALDVTGGADGVQDTCNVVGIDEATHWLVISLSVLLIGAILFFLVFMGVYTYRKEKEFMHQYDRVNSNS